MSDNDPVLMVYITASGEAEADKIAHALVHRKAAACVNILGKITSVYEWKGALEHSDEIALVAKTTEEGFAQLERIVREVHSYECPCIVAWRLDRGYAPYLDWVRSSVRN